MFAYIFTAFFIPLWPEQASTYAGSVDLLYIFLILVTLFFTTLITVVLIYFVIRYRRRSPFEVPHPVAGSLKLESLWTVLPFFIAMGMFVWGASVYFKQYNQPSEGIDISVVAKQWMWKLQHATGQREINELHIPVGRKIRLTMTTEDVIHSFYVPAFRIKMDVVPGTYTYAWFEATKPGRYHLFCAEYCGTNHSGMGGWVDVMTPEDYETWLAGGANSESPVTLGQNVFQANGCTSCHGNGQGGRGPALNGLFGKQVKLASGESVAADDTYIRESIINPQAKLVAGYGPIMPTFKGQLTEEQLLQLTAYIKSLSPEQSKGLETTAPVRANDQGQQQAAPTTTNGGGSAKPSPNEQRNSLRMNPLNSTAPRGNQ